jgi:hypothetical protein
VVHEGLEKVKDGERLFKVITENFPNLDKYTNVQIQED